MEFGATLYVKNSVEALDFYLDAFGMQLGYNAKNEAGTFLHAELEKGGKSIFAVSESDQPDIVNAMLTTERPTMSYGISLESNEELDHAYEKLSEGGHVLRELGSLPWSPASADVVDKYGIYWYIYVSQHRPD